MKKEKKKVKTSQGKCDQSTVEGMRQRLLPTIWHGQDQAVRVLKPHIKKLEPFHRNDVADSVRAAVLFGFFDALARGLAGATRGGGADAEQEIACQIFNGLLESGDGRDD